MSRVLKKQSVDRNVYDLAVERIASVYDRFDHVAVSFSGGKDSTVCLMLAIEAARLRNRLPLEVVCWDEEAIHPETVDYIARVAAWPEVQFRWLCVPIVHRNACSKRQPYWFPWAPEDEAKWCRPFPATGIPTLQGYPSEPALRKAIPDCNIHLYPDTTQTVGFIMGIRAAESLRRYRAVSQRVNDNWIAPDPQAPHVHLLKPIYDWTTTDVWTAPRLLGWDYNRAYDVLERAGVSRHDQRVCPPYGEEPLRGLWQYAQCWPQLWEKMIARVPGAATAGRYCRSPLYAFGDNSKPAHLTWEQAIVRELEKFPDDIGRKVAARIQGEIKLHNRKTGNAPIPDEAEKGLCWKFLYMVAVRGDLKGRKGVRFEEKAYQAAGSRGLHETRWEGT